MIDIARRHWDRMRGTKDMPCRADLDPMDIPQLLPFFFLIDVFHGPLDFRYRLLGEELIARAERNYTGRRVSEIEPQKPPSRMWDLYERTVQNRQPESRIIPRVGFRNRDWSVQQISCPLSDDGVRVDGLWGIVAFSPAESLE